LWLFDWAVEAEDDLWTGRWSCRAESSAKCGQTNCIHMWTHLQIRWSDNKLLIPLGIEEITPREESSGCFAKWRIRHWV
jgi:hypothetical protein